MFHTRPQNVSNSSSFLDFLEFFEKVKTTLSFCHFDFFKILDPDPFPPSCSPSLSPFSVPPKILKKLKCKKTHCFLTFSKKSQKSNNSMDLLHLGVSFGTLKLKMSKLPNVFYIFKDCNVEMSKHLPSSCFF